MPLEDHPGFLGLTSQGVIAIHADWPIYPEEHGADLALFWLTAFPRQTYFKQIGDIDQCCLLLADVKGTNHADPFSEKNLHVAIWTEDLMELHRLGCITGIERPLTVREWREAFLSSLPPGPHHITLPDGTLREVRLAELLSDEEDEGGVEDDGSAYAPRVSSAGIGVTDSGRKRVTELLAGEIKEANFGERVGKLLELKFFDAAVREACVGLEDKIKNTINCTLWGDSLANAFLTTLKDQEIILESHRRILRGEIRTALKFIRNEYMHNLIDLDETQCRALLFRVGRLRATIDRLAALYTKDLKTRSFAADSIRT